MRDFPMPKLKLKIDLDIDFRVAATAEALGFEGGALFAIRRKKMAGQATQRLITEEVVELTSGDYSTSVAN